MSIEAAFTRIAELQSLLGGATAAPTAPATAPSTTTTTGTPSSDQFAQMLRTASLPGATTPAAMTTPVAGAAGTVAPAAVPAGNSPAARMVAVAQGEVGQAESPPGSN